MDSSGNKIKFKQNNTIGKDQNGSWVIKVVILSVVLSAMLYFASQQILKNVNYMFSVLVLFLIISTGIVFDIIGVAVTAADEAPFHALASRKNPASKQAIKLIRNANRVSSFCNDVVGDICGVVTGTTCALIVARLAAVHNFFATALFGVLLSSFAASLMIGGKAAGKTYGMRNSNNIVYRVSLFLNIFSGQKKSSKNG